MCKFNKAWEGKCKEISIPDSEYCKDHTGLFCVSCGSTATRTCDATMGLVCGDLLCDSCEHKLDATGCNSFSIGTAGHCKKGEQEHYAWYAKDEMNSAEQQLTIRGIQWEPGQIHLVTLFNSCTHAPHLPGVYEATVNSNRLLQLGKKVADITIIE